MSCLLLLTLRLKTGPTHTPSSLGLAVELIYDVLLNVAFSSSSFFILIFLVMKPVILCGRSIITYLQY